MTHELFIEKGTDYSPETIYLSSGEILITGESRPENPKEFFDALFRGLKEFFDLTRPISIQFKFDYVSSSSILCILELIRKISEFNQVTIFWLYDELDDDIKELGEIFKDSYNFPIQLILN